MKTLNNKPILIIGIICLILICCCSCSQLSTQCESIKNTHLSLILDSSDKTLFQEVKNDVETNFGTFISKNGLAELEACSQFSLSVCPINSNDVLNARSVKIGIPKRNQSKKQERLQSNPLPIIELIKKSLIEFDDQSDDELYNNGTSIGAVIIKSIIDASTQEPDRLVLLVLTDGIEYSNSVKFYNKVPSEPKDVKLAVGKMIDPLLEEQLNKIQQKELDIKIVMVIKSDPLKKVSKRSIRTFWNLFFIELGFEGKVTFADNLGNEIDLN